MSRMDQIIPISTVSSQKVKIVKDWESISMYLLTGKPISNWLERVNEACFSEFDNKIGSETKRRKRIGTDSLN
jgi:hypothetical protein